MSSHKKELKIKKIARLYLASISKENRYLPTFQTNNACSFLSAVEIAYASLSAPLKEIINNDFFYQDYPGWWKCLYKRSSYLKLKNRAMKNFLEAFYAI